MPNAAVAATSDRIGAWNPGKLKSTRLPNHPMPNRRRRRQRTSFNSSALSRALAAQRKDSRGDREAFFGLVRSSPTFGFTLRPLGARSSGYCRGANPVGTARQTCRKPERIAMRDEAFRSLVVWQASWSNTRIAVGSSPQAEALSQCRRRVAGQLSSDETVAGERGRGSGIKSGRVEHMEAFSSPRKGTISVRAELSCSSGGGRGANERARLCRSLKP